MSSVLSIDELDLNFSGSSISSMDDSGTASLHHMSKTRLQTWVEGMDKEYSRALSEPRSLSHSHRVQRRASSMEKRTCSGDYETKCKSCARELYNCSSHSSEMSLQLTECRTASKCTPAKESLPSSERSNHPQENGNGSVTVAATNLTLSARFGEQMHTRFSHGEMITYLRRALLPQLPAQHDQILTVPTVYTSSKNARQPSNKSGRSHSLHSRLYQRAPMRRSSSRLLSRCERLPSVLKSRRISFSPIQPNRRDLILARGKERLKSAIKQAVEQRSASVITTAEIGGHRSRSRTRAVRQPKIVGSKINTADEGLPRRRLPVELRTRQRLNMGFVESFSVEKTKLSLGYRFTTNAKEHQDLKMLRSLAPLRQHRSLPVHAQPIDDVASTRLRKSWPRFTQKLYRQERGSSGFRRSPAPPFRSMSRDSCLYSLESTDAKRSSPFSSAHLIPTPNMNSACQSRRRVHFKNYANAEEAAADPRRSPRNPVNRLRFNKYQSSMKQPPKHREHSPSVRVTERTVLSLSERFATATRLHSGRTRTRAGARRVQLNSYN